MARALIMDIKSHKILELEGILNINLVQVVILQMGKLRSGNRKGITQGHTFDLISRFNRNMDLLTPTSLLLPFITLTLNCFLGLC